MGREPCWNLVALALAGVLSACGSGAAPGGGGPDGGADGGGADGGADGGAGGGASGGADGGRQANWVVLENQREGTTAWRLDNPATSPGLVEGYARSISVERGERVELAIGASPDAGPITWEVFRMGHYGGRGGRLYAGGTLPGAQSHPEPAYDPATGRVEARWPAALALDTRDERGRPWPGGVYLVKLERADGLQSYVPFVLREDDRDADLALQLSTATWQAYNHWGGESLYASTRFAPGRRAVEVSFDRPIHPDYGFGAGFLLTLELPAVQWLESQGHDIEYTTSNDVGGAVDRLGRPRAFLSVGHDEYSSKESFDRLEAAFARGTSLLFLSGNTWAWAVRFQDSAAGPGLTMAGYKDRVAEDPMARIDPSRATGLWRAPPLNRPENALLGVLSNDDAIFAPVDWVVRGAGHWIYEGTGLRDGDRLADLVFFEWDHVVDNGATPAGLAVVADSPVSGQRGLGRHNATVYERGGAFVFAAGTNAFAARLAEDPRVARMLANALARAGARAHPAPGPR